MSSAKERKQQRSEQRLNDFRARTNDKVYSNISMFFQMKTSLPGFKFRCTQDDAVKNLPIWKEVQVEFAYAMAAFVSEIATMCPDLAKDLMPEFASEILRNEKSQDCQVSEDPIPPSSSSTIVDSPDDNQSDSTETIDTPFADFSMTNSDNVYYGTFSHEYIPSSKLVIDEYPYVKDGLCSQCSVPCYYCSCAPKSVTIYEKPQIVESTFRLEDEQVFPLPDLVLEKISTYLSCGDQLRFKAAYSNAILKPCLTISTSKNEAQQSATYLTSDLKAVANKICACETLFYQYLDVVRKFGEYLRCMYYHLNFDRLGAPTIQMSIAVT